MRFLRRLQFLADDSAQRGFDLFARHGLAQGLIDQGLVVAFSGLGLEKGDDGATSMMETRCLPRCSLTAAEKASRLTFLRPTRRRGALGLEVAGEDFDFMEFRLSHRNDVRQVGQVGPM